MSLLEVMMTVAILGILTSVAIPTYHKVLGGAEHTVASNLVETLNSATKKFSHSQWDIVYTPKPAAASDELYILRSLQWRDPGVTGELNPGGPFMTPTWNPGTSSDDEDYRAEWTGTAWRLHEPGDAGTGLKVSLDGSDIGTPYVFDPNFKPVGMN